MKKINYFDFMGGYEVSSRQILGKNEFPKRKLTSFVLALNETEEHINITIETCNAKLVKPNITLFYAVEAKDAIGYTIWKNGLGPFGIKLS